jgi:hypothetical protein
MEAPASTRSAPASLWSRSPSATGLLTIRPPRTLFGQKGRLVAIIVPFGFFALIGFLVWIVMDTSRQRAQIKATADFNAGILIRISSLKDFSDFVQTDHGAKFMDSLTAERASSGPRDRVLRTTQVGIVVATLGLGLLIMAWRLRLDDAMFVAGITLSQ